MNPSRPINPDDCEPIDPTEPVSTAEGYAIAYVIDGDTIEVTDSHADTEDLYGRLLRYVETADGTDVGASPRGCIGANGTNGAPSTTIRGDQHEQHRPERRRLAR